MKKVFLSLLLASCTIFAFSQAQYNAVTLYYTGGKYEDAKKEVDKLMADPKTNDKAETFLWKAIVYSELYADSTLTLKYPDASTKAFDAIHKYAEKEPDLKKLKDDGMRSLSVLYLQSFNHGRDAFQKKEWNTAYDNFAFSQQVMEFIGKNSLTASGKYTIDTTGVLYAAYAAQNAGKTTDAVMRYKQLADWKINDTAYEDIYKFILSYDTEHKDEASFKKYLTIAKEVHPQDASLWSQYEMNYLNNNAGLQDIISKYKAEDASGKLTEDGYINYAESFATPAKEQLNSLDSASQVQLKYTAAEAFAKAYNLNNTNGIYAFNAGVLYYSVFTALDDRFYNNAGESATLKANRAAIVKDQLEVANKAVEWLEKGYTVLKAKKTREKTESVSLNRCVDYIANLYAWKRDKSRGVNPKDYDAFDAKFQFYDGEHDKYKQ